MPSPEAIVTLTTQDEQKIARHTGVMPGEAVGKFFAEHRDDCTANHCAVGEICLLNIEVRETVIGDETRNAEELIREDDILSVVTLSCDKSNCPYPANVMELARDISRIAGLS
jgi:hypothetical protein